MGMAKVGSDRILKSQKNTVVFRSILIVLLKQHYNYTAHKNIY